MPLTMSVGLLLTPAAEMRMMAMRMTSIGGGAVSGP
jgi:hypothetical protein